jgi:hypothetical protein
MKTLLLVLVLAFASACASKPPLMMGYDDFPRAIPIPEPTAEQRARFDPTRQGDVITISKEGGKTFSGHHTENSAFLEEVITPALEPHLDELADLDPVERINALALFGHEIFRVYFGPDAFAWGGHLHDLDDPQESGPNFQNRFGLDCSGFASLPYELAVHFNLMAADDPAAIFCSQGWERFATENGLIDKGGRDGTTNNWRVDTADFARLGRVIFTVPKDGTAAPENLKKLQAGDVVLMPGHAGLVVEIKGHFYYLEHGGWVVPPNGGLPFEIGEALTVFAKQGPLEIRRSLPDSGRIARQ